MSNTSAEDIVKITVEYFDEQQAQRTENVELSDTCASLIKPGNDFEALKPLLAAKLRRKVKTWKRIVVDGQAVQTYWRPPEPSTRHIRRKYGAT